MPAALASKTYFLSFAAASAAACAFSAAARAWMSCIFCASPGASPPVCWFVPIVVVVLVEVPSSPAKQKLVEHRVQATNMDMYFFIVYFPFCFLSRVMRGKVF